TGAATAGATAAATAASVGAPAGGGDKTITVGSKNFTEQFILGELYAQALEAKGYTVNRKLNLGSEQIADRALQSGQIDMYPEYTGTALGAILKIEDTPATPEETYNVVKEGYAKRNPSVTLLQPADFNNTYGIVVRREIAEQYNLKTLEDLAKASPNLIFASFSEFQDRADGFPNIQKNYPGMNFKDIVLVNSLGLRYAALEKGDADVGVGFQTDGQIASQDLAVMEDPKNIWPFYYPAPAVRTEYLEAHPEIRDILNSVSETLDLETMQELNALVDIEKEDPADVASDFLEEQGLK
ncbi:MAG: glycine/betaine ABC transporter substrate-binding protein, partial [Chloroflexota bacterium]|nr:glycine/betaine ABC transporter substrate-binding protein [Chloroflexota bacterium]